MRRDSPHAHRRRLDHSVGRPVHGLGQPPAPQSGRQVPSPPRPAKLPVALRYRRHRPTTRQPPGARVVRCRETKRNLHLQQGLRRLRATGRTGGGRRHLGHARQGQPAVPRGTQTPTCCGRQHPSRPV